MDRRHLLENSKVFCMKPWLNLAVVPEGGVHPCCEAARELPLGSLKREELADIWNGEALCELRRNMLAGRPSEICARCYELDAAGYEGARRLANRFQGDHFARVEATAPDGRLSGFAPLRLDLMLSNVCNFRCRYCDASLSSAWHKEQEILQGGKESPAIQTAAEPRELLRRLEPLLGGVRRIYFAGGEPLILREHYQLLERLLARGRQDVTLAYSTNFSVTAFGDRDVFALWKRFASVEVEASLDASGKRGEYIRKGQDWRRVVANRERLLRECPQVRFGLTPTLSVLNAFALPDFHREWLELGYVAPGEFHVGFVLQPDILRIQILPAEFKRRVAEKYSGHIAYLRRRCGDEAEPDILRFEAAVRLMMQRDLSHLLEGFRSWTRALDWSRRERFESVFPELAGLMGRRPAEAASAADARERGRDLSELSLALRERRQGRFAEALRRYGGLLARWNGSGCRDVEIGVRLSIGQIQMETGKLQEAEEILRDVSEAEEFYPWKRAEASLALAEVYGRKGLWRDALELCRSVAAGFHTVLEIWKRASLGMGRACLGLEQWEEAEKYFQAVLSSKRPSAWLNGYALLGLAEARERRGGLEEALALYQEVLRDPTAVGDVKSPALYGIGGILLKQGRLEAASENFRNVAAAERGRPWLSGDARLGLAEVFRRQGRKEEALAECRAVLAAAEGLPELELRARCEMGRLHLGAGEWEEAERNYSRVLAAEPRPAWLREEAERELAKLRRRRLEADLRDRLPSRDGADA